MVSGIKGNGLAYPTIKSPSFTDVNARDGEGCTKVFKAALEGNLRLVEDLIAAGADVNARQNPYACPLLDPTPIFGALASRDPRVVQALINAGANVNASVRMMQSSLIYMVFSSSLPSFTVLRCESDYGNREIMEMLTAAGAKYTFWEAPISSTASNVISSAIRVRNFFSIQNAFNSLFFK